MPARSPQFPPTSKNSDVYFSFLPFVCFFFFLNINLSKIHIYVFFVKLQTGLQIFNSAEVQFIVRSTLVASLRLTDKTPKEYAVYRSPLLFWGLVDLVYDMFRVSDSFSPTLQFVYIKSKYIYFQWMCFLSSVSVNKLNDLNFSPKETC